MTNKPLAEKRILVLEDEAMIVMFIEEMLEDLGCKSVVVARNVDQALALVGGQVFDAAVLDVNLNGVKSYPVADALEARGIPFAFSTGYRDQDLAESYRDAPVLLKPFQFEDFGKAFESLLAQ